ncbi:MAG TPA: FliM/FliN family flagellar motor C-terminal domain-containing protein [Dyella sp.]|uniref:FliM/FliN family flagellar motor C-terminal domain-containing protein n=1 Tax=Dyella sp. TaxID=1869338 RepID=UPI002F939D0E
MTEVVAAPIELEEAAFQAHTSEPLIKRNLAMLGHVNVKLDVVLGSAQINVDRLFALGKGDCIELDADLDAPVTLQLDGKPIARGQLMAVGDSFGLKIVEIL